jgi:hypothetical protein
LEQRFGKRQDSLGAKRIAPASINESATITAVLMLTLCLSFVRDAEMTGTRGPKVRMRSAAITNLSHPKYNHGQTKKQNP